MKKLGIALMLAGILVGGVVTATFAGSQPKITICHAAGLDGTTKYVTLTIAYPAVYGPAGHFYENGTPRAGHEQDYLGPCGNGTQPTPTPNPTPTATPRPTPNGGDTGGGPSARPELPSTDTAEDLANVANVVSPGWQWTLFMAFIVGLAVGAVKIKNRITR